ncbi:MAG: AAA family ATPase [Candidatus Caldarchaeum sp.]|nr:AAA family ATPase [Candidatus Caldarchaeum sp.]
MYIVKGGHHDYVIHEGVCTCMAGSFGRECKHVKEMREVYGMPETIGAKPKKVVKSFHDDLNQIFGDGFYNSDVIVSIHAKPATGKTLFALHECAYAAKQGENFLYIDTEGGFKSMSAKWWPILSKRFGLDAKSGKGFVEVRKSLQGLHNFLGYDTAVIWQKEKLEFRIKQSFEEPEIDKFVEKEKIGFIVVDSVSMPVATAINEEQQNRPARFTATALILGKLAELQDKYGVCVLTINHSTWNPTNPYETFAQMRGGKIVQHFSKRIIYMDARKAGELSSFRRLWIARAETLDKFEDLVFVSIDDDGMKPLDIKTGYQAGLLTDNEREHVVENPRWAFVKTKGR